ncbi:hypothetical protein [Fervidicoccus fontis]|jgi:DNA replication factor GINS|uniref:GINS subunit domain-containing protein n=1 Tax=Fervidicoccus fontis (strain DSM 19380 / JCM 18336 / VKM B-2539 / Kam940) TaxID=1163730 RepID=I0A302_FERFK|nr:hypothetical protein [Fervidicoccus fontis]AFH43359.1 hypothetical protein FFONT_1371 [Fervidicoccus fontis Kam940]
MEERLELLKQAFNNTSVKVIAVSDIDQTVLPNGAVLKAKKGEEVELPRWIANFLEERGLVKRKWDEISVQEVSKIHYREMSRRAVKDIEQLPSNFYWLVQEYLDYLEKKIRSEADPSFIEDRQNLLEFLSEIVEKRMRAVITYVFSYGDYTEISQKLTQEEIILAEELKNLLIQWKKIVIGGNDKK